MRPPPSTLLSVFALTLIVGCVSANRFGGDIAFTNKSTSELWVEIAGFDYNPPCGVLIPGGLKGSHMGAMRLPAQVILTWSEGYASYNDPNATRHTNAVSLSSVSNCPSSATITFEFTSNRVWRVFCENR